MPTIAKLDGNPSILRHSNTRPLGVTQRNVVGVAPVLSDRDGAALSFECLLLGRVFADFLDHTVHLAVAHVVADADVPEQLQESAELFVVANSARKIVIGATNERGHDSVEYIGREEWHAKRFGRRTREEGHGARKVHPSESQLTA